MVGDVASCGHARAWQHSPSTFETVDEMHEVRNAGVRAQSLNITVQISPWQLCANLLAACLKVGATSNVCRERKVGFRFCCNSAFNVLTAFKEEEDGHLNCPRVFLLKLLVHLLSGLG